MPFHSVNKETGYSNREKPKRSVGDFRPTTDHMQLNKKTYSVGDCRPTTDIINGKYGVEG